MSEIPEVTKPKNRDEAIEMVERLWAERHRDRHSVKWFHENIEDLEFFSEDEVWELLETYR